VLDINFFTNTSKGYEGIMFGPLMKIGLSNPFRDPFSSPGDSGALVWVRDVNPQGEELLRAVGLLMAASDTYCSACHLDTVFDRLNIEFPLTKAGRGNNLSSSSSPYPAYSYHTGITALERQEILQAHNEERRQYGTSPLAWSPQLAQYAQELAQRLAETGYGLSTGGFNPPVPRDNPLRPGEPLGQNIFVALGPQRAAAGDDAVRSWISEKQGYNYERDDGSPGDRGEFRQVIWNATQFVGCGKAYRISDGTTYIACCYSPAGNWVGQKPY
jgi:pathogenesis-related protein 1